LRRPLILYVTRVAASPSGKSKDSSAKFEKWTQSSETEK
jgi:hypothetical protein